MEPARESCSCKMTLTPIPADRFSSPNTGSFVDLGNNSNIIGGSLKTTGTGVIQTISGNNATLSGAVMITAGSTVNVVNNSSLYLSTGGTYTNHGILAMQAGGNTTIINISGSLRVRPQLAGTGNSSPCRTAPTT